MGLMTLNMILGYAFMVFVVLVAAFVILRVTRMIVERPQAHAQKTPPGDQA